MKTFLQRLWSLWFAFWLFGYFIVLFPVYAIVLARLTPFTIRLGHQLNRWWGYLILFMGGIRVRRHGYYFPDKPCIIVANHRSYLDIPVCYTTFPPRVAFLGKVELARIPLYGWTYRRLHVVVDRKDPAARKKKPHSSRQKTQTRYFRTHLPRGYHEAPPSLRQILRRGVCIGP
jgi:1-acyl-sn-glycerol-3-phosphate acyltransferase